MHPPTFAAGVRLPFAGVPPQVRAWVEGVLGGAIVHADDKVGGFSPGAAAVATAVGGERGFVKAVGASINAEAVVFHRAEREVMGRLPADELVVPATAAASIDVDGDAWEAMLLPVIDGVTPAHPWNAADAVRVLDAIDAFSARMTPSPWPDDPTRTELLAAFFRGWSRVAADETDPWLAHPWVAAHLDALTALEPQVSEAIGGDTLCHCDLRADNVLLSGAPWPRGSSLGATGGAPLSKRHRNAGARFARSSPGRVWLVDWAHARNAARWLDAVLLLCDIVASGADRADGGEIDVDGLVAGHRAFAAVEAWLVIAVIAALAATLHRLSRQPPPEGLPTIRAFQAAQSAAMLDYVARAVPGGIAPPSI